MRWLTQPQNFLPLLALVVSLSSISVLIFYKKRNLKHIPDHERHIMELIIREQEKNKRMAKRVELLEDEVATLKCELSEMDKNPILPEYGKSNSFQNNLQYHTFMQKNQELVLLLQEGLSIEKAAKVSNRSVREVEMVEAVLKQVKQSSNL